MSQEQQLIDRITSRQARVVVIGLGYVGLPLAAEIAEAGFHVVGYDVGAKRVAAVAAGESYIPDVPSERLAELVRSGRLTASESPEVIAEVDVAIVCVPTPLRKTKDPDISFVLAVAEELKRYVHEGMLVVVESTTYPGFTREIVVPRIVDNGFRVGENVFVAFSPERIDPGNQSFGVRNTPKVVGGTTPACGRVASALYRQFVGQVVPASSTDSAEMVKLLENTFRAVNIALVNEVSIMCNKLGIDTWEVIEAAATKPFGFMPFFPGPGLGGHCIPVDPHYLSWKLKNLEYDARFIALASQINSSMPMLVVQRVADALNEDRKAVNGAKILVVGVAYKRDIDDIRESPALDIIKLLQARGAEVSYHDPYVPHLRPDDGGGPVLESKPLAVAVLETCDCVIICTDHKNVDYELIATHALLVMDTRNALRGHGPVDGGARVVRL